MSQPKLSRDVFIALAAVAWADGKLDADEADAIVRAAIEAGLDLEAINEIEAATKTKVEMGTIERSDMSKEDRLFVYAVACWIARLDGKVTPEEEEALSALGERLGVPERSRAAAETLAKQVAALPEGDRPYRYDLGRLKSTIDERLRLAQQARSGG